MAEHQRGDHGGAGQQLQQRGEHAVNSFTGFFQEKKPSTSQLIAVITLFPFGGLLFFISGLTFIGSLVGLLVTGPLFLLFSPIIIAAVLVIGLAVTGFFASGAFGITALSSFSWIVNCLRRMAPGIEGVKRRGQDEAGEMGERVRDVGRGIQSRAHEGTNS